MKGPAWIALGGALLTCLGRAAAARVEFDLVAADSRRVVVTWSPSARQLTSGRINASGGRSGFLVALPPGAHPSLRVIADETTDFPVPRAEVAFPLPAQAIRLAERVRVGDFELLRVETAPVTWAAGSPLPQLHTRVELEITFEGVDAVRATGVSGIRHRNGVDVRSATGRAGSGVVEQVVRASVINGTQVVRSARPGSSLSGTRFAPATNCANCLKLSVVRDGVYGVDHAALVAVPGFDPVGLDPRLWHLYLGGQEIAIEIEGEADGRFDPGDRVVFVGHGSSSLITSRNVYWLVPELTLGRRMGQRSAVPPGRELSPGIAVVRDVVRHDEQNSQYSRMPEAEGKDTWMAALLASNEVAERVTLPSAGAGLDLVDLALPTPGTPYALRAHVVGLVASGVVDDQEMSIAVNGSVAFTARWSSSTAIDTVLEGSVNPLVLVAAGNQFELSQPAPTDPSKWRVNYIDWLEFEYPRRLVGRGGALNFPISSARSELYYLGGFVSGSVRAYEAASGGEVVRLDAPRVIAAAPALPVTLVVEASGPGRLWVVEPEALLRPAQVTLERPSDWRAFTGSSYVIVAHPRFVGEAADVATYRGGVVVDLEDVYDEFSYGMESEQALRDFLGTASTDWALRPEYVLLVGDASHDPKNHLQLSDSLYSPPNLVPTKDVYLESVVYLRAASDSWFAAVVGNDFVPDFAIGRLPARSPGSVTSYLQKLQRYEAQVAAPWMTRVELFADDDAQDCGKPGYFADDLDVIADRYALNAANLDRDYAGNFAAPNAPGNLRAAVLATLSSGVGMQVYSGHGNVVSMAKHCDNPNLSILDFSTLSQINNADRLALGVAMTCDAGEFDFAARLGAVPTYESIAERYLLAPDRGYVGWLATTTVLLYSSGIDLTDELFHVLYGGGLPAPENRILGAVGLSMMLEHFADRGGASRDALETLVVLGDPATRLRGTTP